MSLSSLNWNSTYTQAGLRAHPARQNWMQRAIVNCARAVHDWPFAFAALTRGFRLLQSVNINVTPNHFYWPVPDLEQLEQREWPVYPLPQGCNFDIEAQRRFAFELVSGYGRECNFSDEPSDREYHYGNGYFEAVDCEIAYCMVREFKPRRIVEIGGGYSSRVLAAALQKNLDRDRMETQFVSIDPFPARLPQEICGTRFLQIPAGVQDVELELFDELEANDILFIDSSHVVSIGSDVVRECLEILPRLKPGVLIHVHDIFLPGDYPRAAVLKKLWFWSEQYLLQAFLSFNNSFEVLWASSAMQMYDAQTLALVSPKWRHSYARMPRSKRGFVPTLDGDRVWPSSLWMRRV